MPTETYLKQKTMSYNTFTLPNGLRIIHAPNQSNVAYCGFAVDAGTRDENEQEQGMAHFVEHLIFKGTQKKTCMAHPEPHGKCRRRFKMHIRIRKKQ